MIDAVALHEALAVQSCHDNHIQVCLQNFTVTYPFLIDYDSVEAVVVYSGFASTGSNFVACANMTPPPPDFPTWVV